jgi:hypothetical protein
MRRVIDERAAWADFADVPGGTTGLLVKDYKGKEADQLVYKVDTGLLGELRGHERQAAAELASGRRTTRSASPSTPRRRQSNRLLAPVSLPKYSPPMPRPPTGDGGWMA